MTNLQGNVWHLEGRINNQILEVKGLMKWKHLALPHLNTLFSTFSFKGHLLFRRETKLPFAEKKVDAIFAAIISQLK